MSNLEGLEIEDLIENALKDEPTLEDWTIFKGYKAIKQVNKKMIQFFTTTVDLDLTTYNADRNIETLMIFILLPKMGYESYILAKSVIKETAKKIVLALKTSPEMITSIQGKEVKYGKRLQFSKLELDYSDYVLKGGLLHISVSVIDDFRTAPILYDPVTKYDTNVQKGGGGL